MQYDLLFWLLAVLAAIFVGLGKGGLPVVAVLGVPTLSLVMPTIAAASLLLPVYIVSDIFALYAYRRDYEKEVLTKLNNGSDVSGLFPSPELEIMG